MLTGLTLLARLSRDARGSVAVLIAIGMTVLIGFAALGIETGLWYSIERQDQSAADAAALSGAYEVAAGSALGTYSDICTQARQAAANNGFTFVSYTCPSTSPSCSDPSSGQMCVNNPPAVYSPPSNSSQYVEVYLAQQQDTFFAKLFRPSVTIDTHAVAEATPLGMPCDLALATSGTDISVQGSTSLTFTGCGLATNSNASNSIYFGGGNNDYLTASWFQTVGNYSSSGSPNINVPTMLADAAKVTDPYSCNPPTGGCAGVPTYSWPSSTSNACTSGGTSTPLQPGQYNACTTGKGKNPPMSFSSGTTTLCPGVYYLNGEYQGNAFYVGSGAIVNMGTAGSNGCPSNGMNGVTLIASSTSGTNGGGFQIQGGGVHLSAPSPSSTSLLSTTGAWPSGCSLGSTPCLPFGLLFYQDKSHADTSKSGSGLTADSTITASSSNTVLTGAMYTPATNVKFSGDANSTCFDVISLTMTYTGNSTMTGNTSACKAAGVTAPELFSIALIK